MSSIIGPNRDGSRSPAVDIFGASASERSTVVAIRQQGLRLATSGGLVDARIVKILRIDRVPISRQLLHSQLPPVRRLTARSLSSDEPGNAMVQRQPVSKLVPSPGAKRVGLRSVGEVLTDQEGHLYEARGEQFHALGELVRDEEGRIFEVCKAEETVAAAKETPQEFRTLNPAKKRNRIPAQYLNPQPKFSREEVLYDMKGLLGTLPSDAGPIMRWLIVYPLRLLKMLATAVMSSWRLKKWRALLNGKSTDEKLWLVKAPRGFSHLLAVRRWAEETLAQGGYDSKRMLVEWEIFWRRSGLV